MIDIEIEPKEWFDGGEYEPPQAGDYLAKIGGQEKVVYFDGMLWLKTRDQEFNEVLTIEKWGYL